MIGYVPSNLDLSKLKEDMINAGQISKRHGFDTVIYVLMKLTNKVKDSSDGLYYVEDSPSAISARTFHRISKLLRRHLDYLLENQYIFTDNFYVAGKKCRHYWWSGEYIGQEVKPVHIRNDSRIAVQIRKCYVRDKGDSELESEMIKIFRETVKIDHKAAEEWVDYCYEIDEISEEQYKSYRMTIEKFKNKDFYVHRDGYSGRIHTNITNMKKKIREFIHFGDSKPIISYDIKNSQLYFLSNLMDEEYFGNMLYSGVLNEKFYSILPKYSRVTDQENIKKFQEKCRKGQIYEDVAQVMYDHGLTAKVDRSQAKKALFQLLFADTASRSFTKSKKIVLLRTYLKNEYPGAYKIINLFRYSDERNPLPKILQTVERNFVIDNLGRKLLRKGLKFVTIHDSVLISQKDEKVAEKVINQSLSELINAPTLQKEVLVKDKSFGKKLETFKKSPKYKAKCSKIDIKQAIKGIDLVAQRNLENQYWSKSQKYYDSKKNLVRLDKKEHDKLIHQAQQENRAKLQIFERISETYEKNRASLYESIA